MPPVSLLPTLPTGQLWTLSMAMFSSPVPNNIPPKRSAVSYQLSVVVIRHLVARLVSSCVTRLRSPATPPRITFPVAQPQPLAATPSLHFSLFNFQFAIINRNLSSFQAVLVLLCP